MSKFKFTRKLKRLATRACGLAMATVMTTGLLSANFSGYEAKAANTAEKTFNDIMRMGSVEPGDYKDVKDPYGYGLDEVFLLNVQDELFCYRTNGNGDATLNSYDTLAGKAGDEKIKQEEEELEKHDLYYPLQLGKGGKAEDVNISSSDNTLSYVQTVAFDPDGNGRKDHIGVIGVQKNSNGDAVITVNVIDKNGKGLDIKAELGTANWMRQKHAGNDNDIWDFNAMNFMDITAGDYDGNGEETLVVWACTDQNSYGLYELKPEIVVSYGRLGHTFNSLIYSKKNLVANKELLHNYYPSIYNEYLKGSTHDDVDDKLHCDIDTGDINGDGIDDLVVLSYVGDCDKNKEMSDLYRPMIATRYGKEGDDSDITEYKAEDYDEKKDNDRTSIIGVWKKDGNTEGVTNWLSMLGAGLAVGDVDGNGKDEIVVAGFQNIINGESGKEVKKAYKYDTSKMVIAVYDEGMADGARFLKTTDSNGWTIGAGSAGGLYSDDDSWQRTGVETVAINGKGSAELVFINGQLFELGGTDISPVYQPKYFEKADEEMGSERSKQTYVRSMAAGNFDGNEYGREQIIYVLGAGSMTTNGNVHYTIGMIGGVFEKDGKPTSTAASYYGTTKKAMTNTSHYYPTGNWSSSCRYDSVMNFSICAWDNDHDGKLVKFVDKTYTYTDPEPVAVLQAPPYYEEVDGAMNGHTTSYTISTSYSVGNTTGKSGSIGVGVTNNGKLSVVSWDISVGYCREWSESFTKEVEKTYEHSFDVDDTDEVIIYRTPVTNYIYQVQDAEGHFSNNDLLVFSVPGDPSHAELGIEEYNDFAAYYNQKAIEENEKKPASERLKDEDLPHLDTIDMDKNRLGNAGNPKGYFRDTDSISGLKILQTSAAQSKVVDGTKAQGFSYSEDVSSTKEYSESNGFSFDASLCFGGSDTANQIELYVGIYASYEYMEDYATSNSETKGMGASCSIGHINKKTLEQDLGIPERIGKQYEFNWQMVSWASGLKKTIKTNLGKDYDNDGKEDVLITYEDIPVYGYMLSGLSVPVPKVTELEGELEENYVYPAGKTVNGATSGPAIKISWDKPEENGHEITKFELNITKTKKGGLEPIVVPVDVNVTDPNQKEYTYYYIIDEIVEDKDYVDFAIKITTIDDRYLPSIDSDEIWVSLDPANRSIKKISKTETSGKKDIYTIYYTDGTKSTFEINNGSDGVGVKSIQRIGSSGLNEIYVMNFTDGTCTEFNIPLPKNGKDGNGIRSIDLSATNKNVDTYTITYTNGTTGKFSISNGLSAYEIAVKYGFSGTEEAWLASLKGESAYEIAVRNGFVGTEAQWIASLQGSNGYNGTDGRNGADGKNGVDGKDGKNGTTPATIKSMKVSKKGNLIITMSDGTKIDAGALPTVTIQVEENRTVPTAKLKSVKTDTTTMKATWKAVKNVAGYQIRYSENKDMSDSKIVIVSSASTKSLKISGLSKKTNYYVQIRAYVEDGNKLYCSDWSKKVKVKTTKNAKTKETAKK